MVQPASAIHGTVLLVGSGVFADSLATQLGGPGLELVRASRPQMLAALQAAAPELVVLVGDAATQRGAPLIKQLAARMGDELPVVVLTATQADLPDAAPALRHVAALSSDGGLAECVRRLRLLFEGLLKADQPGASLQQRLDATATRPAAAGGGTFNLGNATARSPTTGRGANAPAAKPRGSSAVRSAQSAFGAVKPAAAKPAAARAQEVAAQRAAAPPANATPARGGEGKSQAQMRTLLGISAFGDDAKSQAQPRLGTPDERDTTKGEAGPKAQSTAKSAARAAPASPASPRSRAQGEAAGKPHDGVGAAGARSAAKTTAAGAPRGEQAKATAHAQPTQASSPRAQDAGSRARVQPSHEAGVRAQGAKAALPQAARGRAAGEGNPWPSAGAAGAALVESEQASIQTTAAAGPQANAARETKPEPAKHQATAQTPTQRDEPEAAPPAPAHPTRVQRRASRARSRTLQMAAVPMPEPSPKPRHEAPQPSPPLALSLFASIEPPAANDNGRQALTGSLKPETAEAEPQEPASPLATAPADAAQAGSLQHARTMLAMSSPGAAPEDTESPQRAEPRTVARVTGQGAAATGEHRKAPSVVRDAQVLKHDDFSESSAAIPVPDFGPDASVATTVDPDVFEAPNAEPAVMAAQASQEVDAGQSAFDASSNPPFIPRRSPSARLQAMIARVRAPSRRSAMIAGAAACALVCAVATAQLLRRARTDPQTPSVAMGALENSMPHPSKPSAAVAPATAAPAPPAAAQRPKPPPAARPAAAVPAAAEPKEPVAATHNPEPEATPNTAAEDDNENEDKAADENEDKAAPEDERENADEAAAAPEDKAEDEDEAAERELDGAGEHEFSPSPEFQKAQRLADRGLALLKHRRLGLSEAAYLKALRTLPRFPRAMAGLARVHLARRDGAEAVRWATRLVAKQPRRSTNQLLLGDALALHGHLKAARKAWRRAVRYGSRAAKVRLRRCADGHCSQVGSVHKPTKKAAKKSPAKRVRRRKKRIRRRR